MSKWYNINKSVWIFSLEIILKFFLSFTDNFDCIEIMKICCKIILHHHHSFINMWWLFFVAGQVKKNSVK